MSRKQEIYAEMLRLSLPHIRNVQRSSWWRKTKDSSCYDEAELIHNLPISLLEVDFVDHDIWFLNAQARRYMERCNTHKSPLYQIHRRLIAELFELVPETMRSGLKWQGPDDPSPDE